MSENSYPLSELAKLLQGTAYGPDVEIHGVGTIDDARAGEIVFIESPDMVELAANSNASALIVPQSAEIAGKPLIVTEDPRLAFNRVLELFAPQLRRFEGIHPTAIVESGVTLGKDVSIGAHSFVGQNSIVGDGATILPLAYVGHEACIGNGTVLHPHVCVGDRVYVGNNCTVHAGAVLGADGFGFAPTAQGHKKVPQIGTVIIEDNVEIGANCTVDRATVTVTRIGEGTKMDDSVHVAHNCTIGKHCLLCAQVGIAGSTTIGNAVVMGGQAGVTDHVSICDNTIVGGQAGIISSIDKPGVYSGYPAERHTAAMRKQALIRRLPDLLKTIKDLEARVKELEQQLHDADGV